MGGSRVQVNKSHKSRFSSKSSRNLHRTDLKGLLFLSSFLFFLFISFFHLCIVALLIFFGFHCFFKFHYYIVGST